MIAARPDNLRFGAVGRSHGSLRILDKGTSSATRPVVLEPQAGKEVIGATSLLMGESMSEHAGVTESVLTLSGMIAPGWWLTKRIDVTVEVDDDGSIIASDDIFLQYGVGNTIREALMDYARSLIDYYLFLKTYSETEPELQGSFRYFQSYLRPIVE